MHKDILTRKLPEECNHACIKNRFLADNNTRAENGAFFLTGYWTVFFYHLTGIYLKEHCQFFRRNREDFVFSALDLGSTPEEQNQSILFIIVCLTAGILSADLLLPLGFVIWVLYLVPLLMSVWLSYRYAPFLIAWFLSGALLLGSLISGAALQDPADLSNRAVFILMITVVALLAWEIKNNYTELEAENRERRRTQDHLEALTTTLEERVKERTRELSDVNSLLTKDIAERERIESALAAANQKLMLLSQITRHDISNRIFALYVDIDLIKDQAAATGDGALAERAASMQRIANGIQAQIAFTRDYQEIGSQAPGWFFVDVLVRNAAEQLDTGAVSIVTSCPFEIFADPMAGKVFYNLIDNALRHGGEKISIITFSCQTVQNTLLITCIDNGAGIPQQDKEHIFKKGFGRDSGLGLFLIHEILSITGISIHEDGEPGHGARFGMIVPAGGYRRVPDR